MPPRSQVVAEAERLRGAAVSAEAARAATLPLDGLDPAAIVWELRQVRSNQGGKYQSALAMEALGADAPDFAAELDADRRARAETLEGRERVHP
jgi:hypothetical protein